MFDNLLTLTDSYKCSHHKQYPPGTTGVYSFFESRGGEFPATTFFGLQYILKRYLQGFKAVTALHIARAEALFSKHFNDPTLFNRRGWERIVYHHQGQLPVRICAVPEGTTVPTGNVLMTVENTDPELPWLVNYLETLLVQAWYPTTVCTQSRAMRRTLTAALEQSGDPSLIDFKLHDFGFRGSTSVESAAIGGCAHLVNFKGTDTLPALECAAHYYGEPMAGFSIPAAEHSTITSWGLGNEVDAYRNMLEQYPTGLVAVVSDSYDIFRACEELWGYSLHDEVLARDGVLVIRPDSGDPPTVVVKVLRILGEKFGFTTNIKGYKVLNPKVRVIQGDGIDRRMLELVLQTMLVQKWSADNIAFGSGGGLLQKVNRDTCQFAFKCSAVRIEDQPWRDVMKDPVTDPGKRSKAGRLMLTSAMRTVRENLILGKNLLEPVFENGVLLRDDSLSTIRARATR